MVSYEYAGPTRLRMLITRLGVLDECVKAPMVVCKVLALRVSCGAWGRAQGYCSIHGKGG